MSVIPILYGLIAKFGCQTFVRKLVVGQLALLIRVVLGLDYWFGLGTFWVEFIKLMYKVRKERVQGLK